MTTQQKAEHVLAKHGVFKGHEGLRGLAECEAFWERQEYGTRLYYGDGGLDYLHRGVLQAAVRALDAVAAAPAPTPQTIYPNSDRGLLEMTERFDALTRAARLGTLRGIQEAAFRAGRESIAAPAPTPLKCPNCDGGDPAGPVCQALERDRHERKGKRA